MKEHNKPEPELPNGWIAAGDELVSWEHTLVKTKEGMKTNTRTLKAPIPEKINNEQLEVLIANYIHNYIDRPKSVPIHTRQLLSALLELKVRRETNGHE